LEVDEQETAHGQGKQQIEKDQDFAQNVHGTQPPSCVQIPQERLALPTPTPFAPRPTCWSSAFRRYTGQGRDSYQARTRMPRFPPKNERRGIWPCQPKMSTPIYGFFSAIFAFSSLRRSSSDVFRVTRTCDSTSFRTHIGSIS